MKKRIVSLLMAVAISLSALISFSTPSAQAASCTINGSSAALCMFANADSGGAVLAGQWNISGYYSDLRNQGFDNVISSIDNWASSTQSFFTDAYQGGSHLRVTGYQYLNYVGAS